MWLKLGKYFDKDVAANMVAKLIDSNVKVEFRGAIEWEIEERKLKIVKLSELSGEEAEKWRRYTNIIRELLRNSLKFDDFERSFLAQAMPEEFEKFKNSDDLSSIAEAVFKMSALINEIYYFLSINDVEIGEYITGNLAEDPEIAIEAEDGEIVDFISFYPVWEIYVDILSLTNSEVNLDGEENLAINAMALLVSNILLNADNIEVDELKKTAIDFSSSMVVDGEEVFEEILKTLEKAGFVSVRGRKVLRR
ncbi:MAG: hypothetical protein QFX40_02115 [Archaeoglobales archaeon]|nr:hypothetical protein [Archaeoglobales archaeon]